MLTEKLQIYKTTRDLLGLMLGGTRNISREVKFAEWADARRLANEALDLIYAINTETDMGESAKLVRVYLGKIYGVANRIRLLSESGYLNCKYKTKIILKIDECSKQGIGWRNYFARNARIGE